MGAEVPRCARRFLSQATVGGNQWRDLSQDHLALTRRRAMATQSATIFKNTHSTYDGSRDEAYTRSYRVIRLVVGFLGISLPLIFILVEAYLLKGGVHVRGSLSAYYHSPLQDVFVGGLC